MKGFKPIVNAESKVLILGTFPSKDSLKVNQYYANATNLFWPLVFAVLDGTEDEKEAKRWNAVTSYKDKIKFTLKHGAALWDVLRSCERKTSADRDILKPKANSFDRFYKNILILKQWPLTAAERRKIRGRKVQRGIIRNWQDCMMTMHSRRCILRARHTATPPDTIPCF